MYIAGSKPSWLTCVCKVFDLLDKQKRLRVLEDAKNKVQVVGLSEKVHSSLPLQCLPSCVPLTPLSQQQVHSIAEVGQLLELGSRCRATGTTSANAASSRSHAVFQVHWQITLLAA
jgi:kinesin family protein 2/24